MNQVKQLFTRYKMLALVFAVVVIWLFFSWQTDGGFLTPRNLSNLLRQMSITGILACGMVLVIISGEIDLSVGSLLGLLGGLAAILDVIYHVPLLANLSLVALCGLLIGLASAAAVQATELVYTPVKEPSTRVAALISGQVDFVLDAPLQLEQAVSLSRQSAQASMDIRYCLQPRSRLLPALQHLMR